MAPKWRPKVTLKVCTCDCVNIDFHIVFIVQNSHVEVQREARKQRTYEVSSTPAKWEGCMTEFCSTFV